MRTVDLDQTATKSSWDVKWYGIVMRIHVSFFIGHSFYFSLVIWTILLLFSWSWYLWEWSIPAETESHPPSTMSWHSTFYKVIPTMIMKTDSNAISYIYTLMRHDLQIMSSVCLGRWKMWSVNFCIVCAYFLYVERRIVSYFVWMSSTKKKKRNTQQQ